MKKNSLNFFEMLRPRFSFLKKIAYFITILTGLPKKIRFFINFCRTYLKICVETFPIIRPWNISVLIFQSNMENSHKNPTSSYLNINFPAQNMYIMEHPIKLFKLLKSIKQNFPHSNNSDKKLHSELRAQRLSIGGSM